MNRIAPLPMPRGTFLGLGSPPPGLIAFAVALCLAGVWGIHGDLVVLAAAVLVLGGMLLWRPGEASVLLSTFLLGWIGASVQLFGSEAVVAKGADLGGDMRQASLLSLLGLLAVAFGMRWGAGPPRPDAAAAARSHALSRPLNFWFKTYVIASIVSLLASGFIWVVPGLSQIVIGVTVTKWAFFYMLAYAAFVRGAATDIRFLGAFAFEFLIGFGGFFSDFKLVFLVTLIAAAAAQRRLKPMAVAGIGGLAALLIALGVVWSSIKIDYRDFISGDSGDQVVKVDYLTAVAKLAELTAALDSDALAKGGSNLLKRLSYVDFFGYALVYVPQFEPHSEGAILADAIVRPFTPRLLFPSKSVIDDTQRTNQYTGGRAGNYEGTSISLGYIAESYIDFGVWGMFPSLLLVGFIFGRLFRFLALSGRCHPLLGMGLAVSALVQVCSLDNSFTKVFGGLVAFLLVAWFAIVFVVPRWVPYLAGRRR